MKSFSHFYLFLLCSITTSYAMELNTEGHFNQSPAARKFALADLAKKIRTLENEIADFDQEIMLNDQAQFAQYKKLHNKLSTLLKQKKRVYKDKTSQGYKDCKAQLKRLSQLGYGKKTSNDLTISVIATKALELTNMETAKIKALLEEKEEQRKKSLEKIILHKMKNLIFNKCDLEELVMQQDNPAISSWQKQRALALFEMATLWLTTPEKTVDLIKGLQSKVKELITSIYAEWQQEHTDPSWLSHFEIDQNRNLKAWEQLHDETLPKLITNLEGLPSKKVKDNTTLDKFKQERMAQLIEIIKLEKQLKVDPTNLETKNSLTQKVKDVVLHIHDEWAHNSTENKSEYSLYWIKKYIGLWNQLQNEKPKEKQSNCLIL